MHSVTNDRRDNGAGPELAPYNSSNVRMCSGTCGLPIPDKRLKAVPHASKCAQCLEAAGDVLLMRRHDQVVGTLETHDVVSTYYKTPNQYLRQVVERKLRPFTHTHSGDHSFSNN